MTALTAEKRTRLQRAANRVERACTAVINAANHRAEFAAGTAPRTRAEGSYRARETEYRAALEAFAALVGEL